MSHDQFDRSTDLQQLRDEGYTVSIDESGYVVLRDVAYVTPEGKVAKDGILAYSFSESGPQDHVVFFSGELPCKRDGVPFGFHSDGRWEIADQTFANYQLSAKDPDNQIDPNYYIKFKRYIAILGVHADALEAGASNPPHRTVLDTRPDSPFVYRDSASSRAGIVEYSRRLEQHKVVIVGLGGTGSYILDLIAKTRIHEIHLYDDDVMCSHNAFRAPGAISKEQLDASPKKVDFYSERYSVMKRNIVPHAYYLDATNAEQELQGSDFVFLSMEGGSMKRAIVEVLEKMNIPFIDASIDVLIMGNGLGGTVQVTTSTPLQREHLYTRVDFSDPMPDDIYSSNIQVADLNSLNAVMAVIKWKKLQGFYVDRRNEHWSAYGVDANMTVNGDEI